MKVIEQNQNIDVLKMKIILNSLSKQEAFKTSNQHLKFVQTETEEKRTTQMPKLSALRHKKKKIGVGDLLCFEFPFY